VAWNYLQAQLSEDPETPELESLFGPGDLTREQALAEIQSILDRAASDHPMFGVLARCWRDGVEDDAVTLGPFTWAVYEHRPGEARTGAKWWLQGYADTMAASGIKMRLAWPRMDAPDT
jgi:hypothetical protein